jgi:hypothetical protein
MTCYDDKECKAWPRAGIFMTKERKAFNSSSINSMSDNFSSNMVCNCNNYSSIQFTGWLPDNNVNNGNFRKRGCGILCGAAGRSFNGPANGD